QRDLQPWDANLLKLLKEMVRGGRLEGPTAHRQMISNRSFHIHAFWVSRPRPAHSLDKPNVISTLPLCSGATASNPTVVNTAWENGLKHDCELDSRQAHGCLAVGLCTVTVAIMPRAACGLLHANQGRTRCSVRAVPRSPTGAARGVTGRIPKQIRGSK